MDRPNLKPTCKQQINPPRRTRVRRTRGLSRLKLIGALVVCAAVGVTLVIWGGSKLVNRSGSSSASAAGEAHWAQARVEAIPVTVVAQGDLMAKDQIDIINLIDHPDDETIEFIVEEGTWVQKGDLLYRLSAPGLVADRDEWISRVREAEADLEEARRNLDIEKDTAASAEDKARLTLEIAKLAHQQWELGDHQQKVNDLNLALEKATRELGVAKRELKFSEELYAEKFISFTELEEDRFSLVEAESALKTAKLKIDTYDKYEKVKTEKEKLSDIKQAEQELARTIRKNENKIELMEVKIESELNEVDQRKTRLADLERMVGNIEVYAPGEGMVLYASSIGVGWERYRIIRQGAGLRGGQRVMVLSNTAQLVANLYVHESRINEISAGQVVSIEVSARPEEVFRATVIGKKNSAVQSGSKNPHLRQYQVFAELPPELGDDIRPGMNCSGEIYIRKIEDALAVPVQAVHTEGGEHFVYVAADAGKVRRQMIELGGANDTKVQIKAGLDEGARVLLRNPLPGELIVQPEGGTDAVAVKAQASDAFADADVYDVARQDQGTYTGQDDTAKKLQQQRVEKHRQRKLERALGESSSKGKHAAKYKK